MISAGEVSANHGRAATYIAAALISFVAGGCTTASSGDDMHTLAASEDTLARTGVRTWGTYEDGPDRWVVALGQDDAQLLRLRAEPLSDELLRLTSEPAHDQIRLSRDGIVDATGAPRTREIVDALYRDTRTGWFASADRDVVATTEQALTTINSEHDLVCNGLFGGDCGDIIRGYSCGGTRLGYDAYSIAPTNGPGSCYVAGWASGDPGDCRVVVHVATQWFGKMTCHAIVYVDR